MKRILVISDSHGNEDGIKKAAELCGEVDAVVHLGDFERDVQWIKNKTVYSVRGNCDMGSVKTQEIILTLEGKRILIVHGHQQKVKLSLLNLALYALERQADIALYGHTHISAEKYYSGVLLYNPGSLSGAKQTYGILTIDNGAVKIKSYKLPV